MRYNVSCEQVRAGIYQKLSASLQGRFITISGTKQRGDLVLANMINHTKNKSVRHERFIALSNELYGEKTNLEILLELADKGYAYNSGVRNIPPTVSVQVNSKGKSESEIKEEGRRLIGAEKNRLEAYFGVEMRIPSMPKKTKKNMLAGNPINRARRVLNACYKKPDRKL